MIVVFGASLLLSVLPFVILLSSLANHRIDTDLSRHIGLNAQGARIVGQLFRSSPAHAAAPIVIALILAAAGTMAVAGSLQVIYEQVFGQQHRGWRDALRFLTWAGVLFGVLVTESVISRAVRAAGGPVAQGLVTYAGTAAFFWWTMHFLMAGRVPWRCLIRAAMLTALFWIGLELFSSVYFSATIISDSKLYGTIGVVFTLLTWFIAIGAVTVLGAVAGAPATIGKTSGPQPRESNGPDASGRDELCRAGKPIFAIRSLTEMKVPRRMACRVMTEKKPRRPGERSSVATTILISSTVLARLRLRQVLQRPIPPD